ncbi:RNA helicase required for poly(A+) mRNA export [Binucleata daphniae]
MSFVIPIILDGKDLAMQSMSGTGKTISFVAPMLDKIKKDGNVQAIIMAPTIELCTQIGNIVNELGSSLNIKGLITTTKESKDMLKLQKKILENFEVIIGTPGGIRNMLRHNLFDPQNIKITVVDEADMIFDASSLDAMYVLKVSTGQKVFFSATYENLIKNMIKRVSPNVEEVYSEYNSKPADIKLFYVEIKKEKKTETLMLLCEYLSIGQMIIFVSTRKRAELIKKDLENDMHKVGCVHGEMDIDLREKTVDEFRKAATKVLVSTDVLSRGIDIPQINLVVNYDMPIYQNKVLSENYIHRIGRCGRFGRTGFVIDFISGEEDYKALIELQDKLKSPSKKFSMEDLKNAFYDQ